MEEIVNLSAVLLSFFSHLAMRILKRIASVPPENLGEQPSGSLVLGSGDGGP